MQSLSISDDGARVFFETSEQLMAADLDDRSDIYEWSEDATRLISSAGASGPSSDASFAGSTADGVPAVIRTEERLVDADEDSAFDLYRVSSTGSTRLVSGSSEGVSEHPAFFRRISENGERVIFGTRERLRAEDQDLSADAYEWFEGKVRLLSVGPVGGNAEVDAGVYAASPNGRRVISVTDEQLTSDDQDVDGYDVYEHFGGDTTLISTGPAEQPGATHDTAYVLDASDDATVVYFRSDERLVPEDQDGREDIYRRKAGVTTLVTGADPSLSRYDHLEFEGMARDGSRIFFMSVRPLTAEDHDAYRDIYEWSNGQLTLVSIGPAGGNELIDAGEGVRVSADGSTAFFHTDEQLTPDPRAVDGGLYRYEVGGGLELITPSGFAPHMSFDGSIAIFRSFSPLTLDDLDSSTDVFLFSDGTLSRISGGAVGGNAEIDATVGLDMWPSIPGDGRYVPLQTDEALTPDDQDEHGDVYLVDTAALRHSSPPEPSPYVPPTTSPDPGALRDGDPPQTSISGRKRIGTDKPRMRLWFKSDEPGSRFRCQLDHRASRWCSAPVTVKAPGPGRHSFRVFAIDSAGNPDPTPARARWHLPPGRSRSH